MHTRINVIRAILAWLAGLAAACAVLYVIAAFFRVTWIQPTWVYGHLSRGRLLPDLAVGLGASVGLVWLYAVWFDALLAGGAAKRGIKYGVIGWLWTLVVLLLL